MSLSIRQKALCGLVALLFAITASGMAQETGTTTAAPAPGCPGGDGCVGPPPAISVMGGPAFGKTQIGVISTGGMAFALQENAEVVTHQPYEAQAVTEVKQTLLDGSHITQTTTATVARDSDGRTVRIQKLSTVGPWKSASDSPEATGFTLTTIFDPVAQTHTDYTSDKKIAHVLGMPTAPPKAPSGDAGFAVFTSGGAASGMGQVTLAVQGHADTGEAGTSPNVKTESLGAKTIEGIGVAGTRTTNTIPAGTIGNDKDIVVTRETWYSTDLKLVLQSTQTDPRFGETSYSLTNIQQNEPDPTLFQVPAGYTIEKVPVIMQLNH